MKAQDAVEWHSEVADDFDSKYQKRAQFKDRQRVWERLIDKHSDADGRVLDLGCGGGVFALHAAVRNRCVVGVDGSAEMLEICARKIGNAGLANIDLVKGDVESVQGSVSGRFSLIICSSVLEYVEDLEGTMRSIGSMLAENGVLIFSLPNANSLYRKFEAASFRLTGYPKYFRFVRNVCTVSEAYELVEELGLLPTEHEFFGKPIFMPRSLGATSRLEFAHNLFAVVARRAGYSER